MYQLLSVLAGKWCFCYCFPVGNSSILYKNRMIWVEDIWGDPYAYLPDTPLHSSISQNLGPTSPVPGSSWQCLCLPLQPHLRPIPSLCALQCHVAWYSCTSHTVPVYPCQLPCVLDTWHRQLLPPLHLHPGTHADLSVHPHHCFCNVLSGCSHSKVWAPQGLECYLTFSLVPQRVDG